MHDGEMIRSYWSFSPVYSSSLVSRYFCIWSIIGHSVENHLCYALAGLVAVMQIVPEPSKLSGQILGSMHKDLRLRTDIVLYVFDTLVQDLSDHAAEAMTDCPYG